MIKIINGTLPAFLVGSPSASTGSRVLPLSFDKLPLSPTTSFPTLVVAIFASTSIYSSWGQTCRVVVIVMLLTLSSSRSVSTSTTNKQQPDDLVPEIDYWHLPCHSARRASHCHHHPSSFRLLPHHLSARGNRPRVYSAQPLIYHSITSGERRWYIRDLRFASSVRSDPT